VSPTFAPTFRDRIGPIVVPDPEEGRFGRRTMTKKRKTPTGEYAVGKADLQKPRAGRRRRPPREDERIERLFRRRFAVIERGEKVPKTGFAIIHAQLLMKESSGHRRAGKTRDRYEAFARAHGGMRGVLLRRFPPRASDLATKQARRRR
jgi:hypothetical protein